MMRSTRWRFRGMSIVALAIVAMSPCNGGLPEGFREVDLGNLLGDEVSEGSVLSGEQLPFLSHNGKRPGAIFMVDTATASVSRLPALPTAGWVADTQLVATKDYLVALADVCPTKPYEGDAGFECPDDAGSHPELFAYDFAEGEWYHRVFERDTDRLLGSINAVVGRRAQLGGPSYGGPGEPPDERQSFSLSPGLPSIPNFDVELETRCSRSRQPRMIFDRSPNPTSASVADGVTGERSTFKIPASIAAELSVLEGPSTLPCRSASTFIATEGDLLGSNGIQKVVDISRPDVPPVDVGYTRHLGEFIAGTGYWAFDDDEGFHIHDAVTGTDRIVELRDRQRATALPHAIVLVTRASDGDLVRIAVAPM